VKVRRNNRFRFVTMPRKNKSKKAKASTAANKPQGNPKPKGANRPRARGRGGMPTSSQLSACAVDYAKALIDPETSELACVPAEFPPLPSQKVRVFCKGSAYTSSTNFGFIVVNPRAVVTNDTACVTYSGPTYAGTAVNSGTGMVNATSNSPFTTVQYGNTATLLKSRLVGVMLKAWYLGTEMDMSGQMIAFRQPDNADVTNSTVNSLLSNNGAKRVPITSARKEVSVHWVPTDPADTEYNNGTTQLPPMCIAFTGVASKEWVAWEMWAQFEVIGQNAPSKTLSHADPEGFSAVLTAANQIGDSLYGSAKEAIGHLLSAATTELGRMSGHVIRGATQAAIGAAYYGMRNAGGRANNVPTITGHAVIPSTHDTSATSSDQPQPASHPPDGEPKVPVGSKSYDQNVGHKQDLKREAGTSTSHNPFYKEVKSQSSTTAPATENPTSSPAANPFYQQEPGVRHSQAPYTEAPFSPDRQESLFTAFADFLRKRGE
jgi:hypothetical protein